MTVDPKDILAAERTLLAWIRTGIALMGLGFVVARFGFFLRELALVGETDVPQLVGGGPVGLTLVVAGIVVNLWATARHRVLVRRFREGSKEVETLGPVLIGIMAGLGGIALAVLLSTSLH